MFISTVCSSYIFNNPLSGFTINQTFFLTLMKIKKQRVIILYLVSELLLLNLATVIVFIANQFQLNFDWRLAVALTNLGWFVIVLLDEQRYYHFTSNTLKLKSIFFSFIQFLGLLLIGSVLMALKGNFAEIVVQIFIVFFLLDLIFLELLRPHLYKFALPKTLSSNILILGTHLQSSRLLDFTSRNSHLGFNVLGLLDDQPEGRTREKMQILGGIDDLSRVLEQTRVDEIIVAWPLSRMNEIDYVIQTADQQGVRVSLMPSLSGDIDFSIGVQNVGSLPILEVRKIALDKFANAFIKRFFDLLFTSAVLILLSPLFILIAALIKLSSPGPVFYKPFRNGQGGSKFSCYKFRTMRTCDDENGGSQSTVRNDPRITPLGHVLRKYDLDELPQFFNVIRGDMSVVGPRPHRIFLNDTLKNVVERYMIRHYVRPGITGWAQVNGWRGPTETNEQRIQRIRHDLWYIRNWNFWLDIKIIFLTVFSKKARKNAF